MSEEKTRPTPLDVALEALREIEDEPHVGFSPQRASKALADIADAATPTAEDFDAAAGTPAIEPLRYALVEQMGHRATTASVRETTFLGEPMLETTGLLNGRVHLVSPKSLYEVTWLTEAEARQQLKPWTAVALPAAHYDTWDERDDADRQGNGEPNDLADVDL